MIVKLLTEHHLEFLNLKGGCRGSSESTLVKMPHCWKSHAVAQLLVGISSNYGPLSKWFKDFNSMQNSGCHGNQKEKL